MTTSTSPTASGPSAADQAAVAAVPQRVVAAWADQDADAFAGVFTDDGTMILPGLFCKGRDQIRSFMADAFAGALKDTRVIGRPLDVRFLSDTVGLLITEGGVLASGGTEVSGENAIRASWLVVRQDEQWRLAAYQNGPRDDA
jgi:uncharacterized protein (TIGR02246 family)